MSIEYLLTLTRRILEQQIDRLRSAHEIVEAALHKHEKGVDEWYQDRLAVVDEDEITDDGEFLGELFEEQKSDATVAFPLILRSSLFATGYGVLEHFMNSVCKQAHVHLKGPALRDLRGEGIVRAQLYLTAVAKVAFPDTDEWQDLRDYGHLRNALVHAQGDLTDNDRAPRIEHLAQRTGSFTVATDKTRIALAPTFNPRYLDTAWAFAEQLEAAWRQR